MPQWSDNTIVKAFQLKFACGVGGYKELVNQNHPLPSLRTLRSRKENCKFNSGDCDEIFEFLKLKVSNFQSDIDKNCLIILDEISIVAKLCYDNSNESFIGNVTLPNHDSSEIATHALVFMIADIAQRWKQTIDYYFTGNATDGSQYTPLLLNYINKAHEIGLNVHGIVSDMGSTNQSMWRSFGINAGRFSVPQNKCQHPIDSNRYLFFFHDASHAFKNLKEGMMNNKDILIPQKYVTLYNLSNNVASSSHLHKLLEVQNDLDLKLAPKLCDNYLNTKNHFQKMRVKSASHVLSHELRTSLKFLSEEQNKPEYESTSWLVGCFSKWFKIMSARNMTFALSKKNEKVFNETIAFLYEFVDIITSLKFGHTSKWKPFQKGIVITILSFLELSIFLINKRNYKFVMGGRFTQDCTENLFSVLRMKNCILNAVQFKNNLKLVTISYYMRRISSSNYDEDERVYLPDFLQTVKVFRKGKEMNNISMCTPSNIHYNPDAAYQRIVINNIELNVLHHIAGYLIRSIANTQKICKNCLLYTGNLRPTITTYNRLTSLRCYGKDTLFFVNPRTFNFFIEKEKNFRLHISNIKSYNDINLTAFFIKKFEAIPFFYLIVIN